MMLRFWLHLYMNLTLRETRSPYDRLVLASFSSSCGLQTVSYPCAAPGRPDYLQGRLIFHITDFGRHTFFL